MAVVVLGGGIGGLSTAYYLLKSTKFKVILLEASSRLGGWIRSEKHPSGLILEEGPRTLRPKGEAGLNTLSLIDDLGLAEDLKPILSTHPAARNRFVYANGKLYKLPSNLSSIFRKTPPFTKPLAYAVLQDLKSNAKYVEDDSIYDFTARRFGKEIADYAISPLICGICGGNAKHISVNFLLNSFFEKEQTHGSVLLGSIKSWSWKRKNIKLSASSKKARQEKWSSYSFRDGLESLPLALRSKIEQNGGTIMKNTEPSKIDFRKNFVLVNEKEIPFKFLVSTVPTYSLAKLVYNDHYNNLAKHLLKIPYTSIITVNLVYKKKVLDIDGFGFLVPPAENLPILGVIFDSCYAPFEDWTVLTVMMGGHAFHKFFNENLSQQYILSVALENIKNILNISAEPDLSKTSILKNCIPQHMVGHNRTIKHLVNYIQLEKLPLFLVGNAYKGTGINDVILSAKNTVDSIINYEKQEEQFETPRYTVDYL